MLAIRVCDVWKSYGSNWYVLKGINLSVGEGEFISIRGKSGVGKSTLLRLIGLLDTPTKGKIFIYGKDTSKLGDKDLSKIRLKTIGFVFQFFNLIPYLTVLENIMLPMAIAGERKEKRKGRAMNLLSLFGLEDLAYKTPREISGGEQQRVAVIRALANGPKIILADEPTAYLDDENSELLMNLLKEINKKYGVTIVLSSTSLYQDLPTTSDYLLKNGTLMNLR